VKVQAYEPFQVKQRPLNAPMQGLDSRGAFGEGLAKGMTDLAASLVLVQDEDDKAVVKERIADYRKHSTSRLYGDEDAYFARQGRNAYDSKGSMNDELSKYRDGLTKGLSNNQQRMFTELSNEYLQRDNSSIAKHAQTGRMTWLNDNDEANVLLAQQDMGLYSSKVLDEETGKMVYGNAVYANQIKRTYAILGKRNGWPAEKTEVMVTKALTAGHMTALENMLVNKNFQEYEKYFEDHKGEISSTAWAKIDERFDNAAMPQLAQALAEQALIRYPDDIAAQRAFVKENEKDAGVRGGALALLSKEDAFLYQQLLRRRNEADRVRNLERQRIADERQANTVTGTELAEVISKDQDMQGQSVEQQIASIDPSVNVEIRQLTTDILLRAESQRQAARAATQAELINKLDLYLRDKGKLALPEWILENKDAWEEYFTPAQRAAIEKRGAITTDWDVYAVAESEIEAGDYDSEAKIRSALGGKIHKTQLNTLVKLFKKRSQISNAELRRLYTDYTGKRLGTSANPLRNNAAKDWNAFKEFMVDRLEETRRPGDLEKWAERWTMQGRNPDAEWFTGGDSPDTYGEAVRTGFGETFEADLPDGMSNEDVIEVTKSAGIKGGTPGQNYLRYYAPASDWLRGHEVTETQDNIAVVVYMMKLNFPLTTRNFEYVLKTRSK
jgi:hypothetical protein